MTVKGSLGLSDFLLLKKTDGEPNDTEISGEGIIWLQDTNILTYDVTVDSTAATDNYFPIGTHNIATGYSFFYISGTVSELSENTEYFAVYNNTTSIKLATSLSNAIAGSPTTITITAGTAKLRLHSYYFNHTSGAPIVTSDSGSIKVAITAHGLSTGDVIKYKKETGSSVIGNLTDETDYFVINSDANYIHLATTHLGSLSGTKITYVSAADQTFTFTIQKQPQLKMKYKESSTGSTLLKNILLY